ncbi:terpene cyclase/mutase family protein [Nocardioides dongxiaopingii]|uniref:prenyltransferase/squalene oxidase repeat-containing protein n=1 Tax=Nocardioides sp. S-1144 TaxID=2582905 RepID=UPI00110D329D|nr:prenyltransferase/squalene oxidase repeat-containing protein [Nocardioides sp. S-1144]QCW50015.1 terpene cyclase/mutase family protein [Nocardioides sp. S-1144]
MSSKIVRGAAVLAGSTLALSLSLSVPSAQADVVPAPAGADPGPAAGAAAFLAAQPGADGIIKTFYEFPPGTFDSYVDYGLTVDAGYALDAVGGQGPALTAMTDALQAGIGSYATSGGARAKLSSFLLSQGRTGAAVDALVDDLEDDIATSAPLTGRLVDPDPNDYNTPLTQAYAVSALHDAGSSLAAPALDFALAQQCAEGFFRSSFADKSAADQSCDANPSASGSVDTTALTVLMLQDQKSAPAVQASITEALDWLEDHQAPDGSFSSGNANATGLAGWALGVSGRTAPAQQAAGWLRAHQLVNAGSCAPYAAATNGAVVLDDLGLLNASSGPLDQVDNSVATRATTQALPALLWAAGGRKAGASTLTGTTSYVADKSKQTVTIQGAPGNTLCVKPGGKAAQRVVLGADGRASVAVTLPQGTRRTVVSSVDAAGRTATTTFRALGATQLRVDAPKNVKRGARAGVKVTKLAAGEKVKVSFRGKVVARGTANARGVFRTKIVAKGKPGKVRVKVVGQLADRRGSTAILVKR